MKAAPRFELGDEGFAIQSLTTWLYRLRFIDLDSITFSKINQILATHEVHLAAYIIIIF